MSGPAVDRSDRQPPDRGPLREAVERAPGDAAARRRLGWALCGAGEADEALAVFRRATRDFPNDIDLLYGLGLAAKQSGAVDEADEAFQRVADLAQKIADPGRGEILHRLATGHHNRLRTGHWGLKQEIWGGA